MSEQTLVIYDDNGVIFTQVKGDFIEPNGLQHLIVEVPDKHILVGVDVKAEPHQIILEAIPKTETELLREELQAAQQAIDFLLMGGM